MWDKIDTVLKYTPKYFWFFGRCLSNPQRFVDTLFAEQNDEMGDEIKFTLFQDALIFLSFSVLLSVFMKAPSVDSPHLLRQVGFTCLVSYFSVALLALALRASWCCVGGKTDFVKYFVIDAYAVGIATVLLSVVALLQGEVNEIFGIPDGEVTHYVIVLIGFSAVGIWVLIFWETYRLLNNLGNGRACLALLIFNILTIPIVATVWIVETKFN